jgi:hypothetical protein
MWRGGQTEKSLVLPEEISCRNEDRTHCAEAKNHVCGCFGLMKVDVVVVVVIVDLFGKYLERRESSYAAVALSAALQTS